MMDSAPILSVFREYEPHELGADGYPRVWHAGLVPYVDDDAPYIEEYGTRVWFTTQREHNRAAARLNTPGVPDDLTVGVKDVVRMLAGHRCIRCRHPYREGRFTWDDSGGPARAEDLGALPSDALTLMSLRADATGSRTRRPTHWSPCDDHCRHGAPVRVRDGVGGVSFTVEATPPVDDPRDRMEWRYSWPTQAREALNVTDDEHGAGALVVQGNEVEAAWRILTVHHLNGRKHDLRWWNLTSLCQRCHLLIQKTVILERVWPWEHDEWFKPYAAGWYAYAYLGENLTPIQTLDRLDELLALERMA